MANSFSVTDFTSKTLGTFLESHSNILKYAYRGVKEFEKATGAGYAPGNNVDIKIPGYPTVQRGVAVTAEDVIDRVVSYQLTNNDIYNFTYDIDIQDIGIQVVGGELAFSGNPFKNPNDAKELNPQAVAMIDNYVTPAGQVIAADIETELATKMKNTAFYTPIDTPAKLKTINSYADISKVRTLMNELGFMKNRMAFTNENDFEGVNDSLQNMYNEGINKTITETGKYGQNTLANFNYMSSNVIPNQEEAPQYSVNPNFTVSSVSADGSQITFAGVDAVLTQIFNAGSLIAIPSVNLFNKVTKKVLETTLVVCVAEDANGDGAGNVTVTLSEPLAATGMHANVNMLPVAAAPAELFPAHRNNFFIVPMGIIANPIKLGRIAGADNNMYMNKAKNMVVHSYIQGLVTTGVNTYRMSCQCPTLAIASYIVNLPSLIS